VDCGARSDHSGDAEVLIGARPRVVVTASGIRFLVQPPQAADIAALASPDWARQTDDVSCPMCEYNLRGLAEPRCPECGYRFAWKDLLDAKARAHAYLYEHHPEFTGFGRLRRPCG
jgi:hypothetical protein